MKRLSFLILMMSFLGLCACGPMKSQAQVPTVNGILTKYVNALGGRAAISDLTTRTSKGTLELVGQAEQGTASSFAKAPNKYLSVISLPKYGEVRRGFDGSKGWVKGTGNPTEDLAGEAEVHGWLA